MRRSQSSAGAASRRMCSTSTHADEGGLRGTAIEASTEATGRHLQSRFLFLTLGVFRLMGGPKQEMLKLEEIAALASGVRKQRAPLDQNSGRKAFAPAEGRLVRPR